MKYKIDHINRIIISNEEASITKLEYKRDEDILHLRTGETIHLNSEGYLHPRLMDYDNGQFKRILDKFDGKIDLNDLKELKSLEIILHNSIS